MRRCCESTSQSIREIPAQEKFARPGRSTHATQNSQSDFNVVSLFCDSTNYPCSGSRSISDRETTDDALDFPFSKLKTWCVLRFHISPRILGMVADEHESNTRHACNPFRVRFQRLCDIAFARYCALSVSVLMRLGRLSRRQIRPIRPATPSVGLLQPLWRRPSWLPIKRKSRSRMCMPNRRSHPSCRSKSMPR